MENEQVKTTVSKGNTAKIKTKTGGEYSYKYTDLAQIHEYLESNKLKYYQFVDRVDNDDYIMTVPIIDGKEQAPRRGVKIVDANLMGNDNPAQKQGSATTYARRYSLLMAFGLATDDDDANSLSNNDEEITLDYAKNYKLTFGKNNGKTLLELIDDDPNYLDWLYNNERTDKKIKDCIDLLNEECPKEELSDRDKIRAVPCTEGQKQILRELDSEYLKEEIKTLKKAKLSDLTFGEAQDILDKNRKIEEEVF